MHVWISARSLSVRVASAFSQRRIRCRTRSISSSAGMLTSPRGVQDIKFPITAEVPTRYRDDSLIGSWPALMARPDGAGTVRRWAVSEPALTGLAGVDDLTEVLAHGADPDRCARCRTTGR
jgi:hypothetical protein